MKVVGHEDPGKQPGLTVSYVLRKSPEKLLPVFGVPKNGGSLNSPGHYMVEKIGKIQPGSSGHGGILIDPDQEIKITFISYQRPPAFQLSFTCGVRVSTSGDDFGLDVYDDVGQSWHTIFSRNYVGGDVGDSGTINLASLYPTWEVTAIRFHDGTTYDVGLDNLTIVDNRSTAVPEPLTMLLVCSGLIGLWGIRKRIKK